MHRECAPFTLLIRFCAGLGGHADAGSDEGVIDGGVVVDRRDVHEEQKELGGHVARNVPELGSGLGLGLGLALGLALGLVLRVRVRRDLVRVRVRVRVRG